METLTEEVVEHLETFNVFTLTGEKEQTDNLGRNPTEVNNPARYVPPAEKEERPSWSMDVKELKRVVSENYETLFNESGAHISNIINSRSMSQYDIFAEGLTRMLYANADFHYVNDFQTLDYIRTRLKRHVNTEEVDARRKPTLPYRDDLLSNSVAPEEYNPLEGINTKDKEVIKLCMAGYTQKEIGEKLGISQPTVHRLINKVYNQLKTA